MRAFIVAAALVLAVSPLALIHLQAGALARCEGKTCAAHRSAVARDLPRARIRPSSPPQRCSDGGADASDVLTLTADDFDAAVEKYGGAEAAKAGGGA